MRIALVAPRFAPWPGGVETHVEQLARHLALEGHDVEVLTQDPAPARVERRDGYVVRRFRLYLGAPHDTLAPGLVTWLARRSGQYDIVHAHSYHALPALAAAHAVRDTPLVVTGHYHGTGHTPLRARLHRIYRPIGSSLLARASALVCVSRAEQALVAAHFPQLADRTTVIPNGVSPPSRAPSFPVDGRVVLSVGRLEPYKRIDAVLRALPHLPPDILLVVVGEGPDRPRLEALVVELGLTDRVLLTGRADQATLERWWASASVFATASEHEAFGLTLAEALSVGVPVVASAIPAHAEVVDLATPGPHAQLFEGLDPHQLANAVLSALAAPHRPARLPTWQDVAAQVAELYGKVVLAIADAEPSSSLRSHCVAAPAPAHPGEAFVLPTLSSPRERAN